MTGAEFIAAVAALHRAGAEDDLCGPFLSVLPVTAVAISTLGDPLGSETVCASDSTAARLEEIQLDLGEGPCWEAVRTGRPVLEPDLQRSRSAGWPVALTALRDARLGAVFAFPIRFGTIDIGAVDLYHREAAAFPEGAVEDATVLAEAVARQVLRRALAGVDDTLQGHSQDGNPYSRREVYQASGMLAAQTGAGPSDALLLLRAHAYAAGRPVRDLARDVIARDVDFTDHTDSAR